MDEAPGSRLRNGRASGSERELIERCRQGDEQAFRELVDQYKNLVFALVARSVRDRARAEDIAQDVFLRVHRGLPYFRGEARLSTWIYRIVANQLAAERRPAEVSIEGDDDRKSFEPGANDPAFDTVALRDRMSKAIERLPVHYQILINGHYVKGLRYEDLAEALELPMGTVKTHLHRAKRQLRHLLETEFR